MCVITCVLLFFFFTHTATTEIYTLSLHDALPICACACSRSRAASSDCIRLRCSPAVASPASVSRSSARSEEHTSELQSLRHLVCRLLLEKKKTKNIYHILTND